MKSCENSSCDKNLDFTDTKSLSSSLSPREIVAMLDEYVVGQEEAKKALAIALRNRKRALNIKDQDIKENLRPNNILVVGPTGTGKTALLKRIAKIDDAPFVKVDATQFTEVGYVGRDVSSIIHELVDAAIIVEKKKRYKALNKDSIKEDAEKKVVSLVLNRLKITNTPEAFSEYLTKLQGGGLSDIIVEVELPVQTQKPQQGIISLDMVEPGSNFNQGSPFGLVALGDIFKAMSTGQKKVKRLRAPDAVKALVEANSIDIESEELIVAALKNASQRGIVFVDEIDKIVTTPGQGSGGRGEISREGVQRDLITLVEGSLVQTKYGSIETDNILFVVAGAFHASKPADLLPELRGRFPVEVQMQKLTIADFVKILTVPKYNILRLAKELLKMDNIELEFTEDGIIAMAELTERLNYTFENIGARRLLSVMDAVVAEVSFEAMAKSIVVDRDYVLKMVEKEFLKQKSKKEHFVI